MFRFDFEVEPEDAASQTSAQQSGTSENLAQPAAIPSSFGPSTTAAPFEQISLETLLDSLPPKVSFTRLENGLSRRDLFDSRFQILSESDAPEPTILDQDTDLQPGVYEGGFKTWECANDLVVYLTATERQYEGKSVCELGCGTALPTCAALAQRLLSGNKEQTKFTCMDFNKQVLELVTLPNLILTWHGTTQKEEMAKVEDELELSDELLQHFQQALRDQNITLDFFCGSWDGAVLGQEPSPHLEPRSMDLILTSETIYEASTLPSLLRLLHQLPKWPGSECLVAAKRVYFGLNGGVHLFQAGAEAAGAQIEEVAEVSTAGVERTILKVTWQS